MHFKPRNDYRELGDGYYDAVEPAKFDELKERFWNQKWAARVGLEKLTPEERAKHFGKFEPLPDAQPQPLAMRYHGHQFRHYNPDLGDGRGFLFAQCEDLEGRRLLDFGTKGSGQTPYSRRGDGRLTLKGAVREVLATEMLEALGVYTSKTFCFFETDERLRRNDEPSPTRAAVLTRLSHSHIRYGTFQRLAAENDRARVAKLVDYCLDKLLIRQSDRLRSAGALSRESSGSALISSSSSVFREEDRSVRFFELVVANGADLAASWMMAGFVHGVLNSDNMNITGESFDYGPWRFLPTYDADFTAAYFDESGLYAYGRQPEAVYWNLDQLGLALGVVAPGEKLRAELEKFPQLFQEALLRRFFDRLGVEAIADDSRAEEFFVAAFQAMGETQCGFEDFFFDWYGANASTDRRARSPRAALWQREGAMRAWGHRAEELKPLAQTAKTLTSQYYSQFSPETLLIDEVEAIWAPIAERDDWTLFYAKIDRIRARNL